MRWRARTIDASVVVVAGATSGVGRAVARSLATHGARLVLVARDGAALADVEMECGTGRAVAVVVADISEPAGIERVMSTATERFGHVDTWITTAAELVVGDLADQTVDDVRRLLSTNVVGTALASRAAMGHFRSRGAGVLINVSSLLGLVPNPLAPTYAMSRFAVRGLTLSLDQRRFLRSSPVRACVVLPGPIDTPMFEQAVNRTGRTVRAIPPAQSPERVAAVVIRSVRRPRRQRTTGLTGVLTLLAMRVAPRLTETAVAQYSARLIVRTAPADHPPGRRVGGGWRLGRWRRVIGDAVGRCEARRHGWRRDARSAP